MGQKQAVVRSLIKPGTICYICGSSCEQMDDLLNPLAPVVDHVIPIAAGGTHDPENLRVAHRICNGIKAHFLLEQHPSITELSKCAVDDAARGDDAWQWARRETQDALGVGPWVQ